MKCFVYKFNNDLGIKGSITDVEQVYRCKSKHSDLDYFTKSKFQKNTPWGGNLVDTHSIFTVLWNPLPPPLFSLFPTSKSFTLLFN
jgi:hypothetical protein